MIYTTKELLEAGETEYSIRKKINNSSLHLIERGYYSTNKGRSFSDEVFACKKYPHSVLTGLTAFFVYGLTDYIPENVFLATEQHSFPIRRKGIKQSYQASSFFSVGVYSKQLDEGAVTIYDLERLLIELIRLKEKYPREIYYEVVNSFRKIKETIDFYKVNQYLKSFTNGDTLLQKIKEVI